MLGLAKSLHFLVQSSALLSAPERRLSLSTSAVAPDARPATAPDGPLAGRVALVTGGTRGIGRAAAHRLAAAGAEVLLTGRDAAAAEAAAAQIAEATGAAVRGIGLDQADQAAVDAVEAQIAQSPGRLDILVANAGIMPVGPIGGIPAADARAAVETNILGSFAVLQAAARLMTAQGRGSIILISSLIAARGIPGMAAYASTKGALSSLTLSAAAELGPQGVRVNAIAPGIVRTDMTAIFPDEMWTATTEQIPLRRPAVPEDIAGPVLFLAGDDSAYINGHVLAVDGGLMA